MIDITRVELTGNALRVKVKNMGNWSATNLRIEICALDGEYTYHLLPDFQEFLILPGKVLSEDTARVFQIRGLHPSAERYNNPYNSIVSQLRRNELQLRIRIHGFHSWSGLGKAYEYRYRYCCNEFTRIYEKSDSFTRFLSRIFD